MVDIEGIFYNFSVPGLPKWKRPTIPVPGTKILQGKATFKSIYLFNKFLDFGIYFFSH